MRHRQRHRRAGHGTGGIGNDATVNLAVVERHTEIAHGEKRFESGRAGEIRTVQSPLVRHGRVVRDQERQGQVRPLHGAAAGRLRVNAGEQIHAIERDEPGAGGAGGGQWLLETAVGQLPAHRQIVAPAALLHECLEIITASGLEKHGRALLVGFFGPFARVRPGADPGVLAFVAGGFIAADEQDRAVIAGNPKDVVAAHGRHDEGPDSLAVVIQADIHARFKIGVNLRVSCVGVVRPVRIVRRVGKDIQGVARPGI